MKINNASTSCGPKKENEKKTTVPSDNTEASNDVSARIGEN
ncbi:hypothetical protein T260_17670 [Geobacillus thermopakistaniensis]|uniref:Uncharacterized protein n=1 Tax=Geobacillus thermopakistaniensis (strain MAS1) TaxID=1408282 RepID=A0A7U9J831_GEOTM|nr:hypothetical protein GA8_12200 [Geobacillus sp. A8]ESU70696.1 hypothetical protein T260_17670 [Geobacillus sp. MAS1]